MASHIARKWRQFRVMAKMRSLFFPFLLLVSACGGDHVSSSSTTPPATPVAAASTAGDQPPPSPVANIDGPRIINADTEPENWLAHGRTYGEQRYSPLRQINHDTVSDLGFAWEYATGSVRGLEATPIVVDGVMYATAAWSRVFALDAKTGAPLWTFDPQVPGEWARYACCDVVNRGVAVWKGRVYVASLDGRLFALDAQNGDVIWEQNTIDRDTPYTITGAPRIVNDKVIIGNGGAEYGVRGYITAFDAASGDMAWRFYTVPGDPEKPVEHAEMEIAMPTWNDGGTDLKWWELGGGGTVWDAMAYDPALNLLYIGVGNGAPWNRWVRSPGGGDNLFLSSIIALNPETGAMAWYYQTTPGDNWDYTATQHLMLATLNIDGADRDVIMQAPKNGFFYVIDRATGELLSADAYAKVTWADGVDPETGRPIENDTLSYKDQPQGIFPGPGGAHNWHPMAFHPGQGLVYIPVHDNDFIFANEKETFAFKKGVWNTGSDFAQFIDVFETLGLDIEAPTGKGYLKAWDPVARKTVWQREHVTIVNGGLLATGGDLVFQGSGDGAFFAYDAANGDVLWEMPLRTGVIAPPITYRVDGEQYVAVLAGLGGGGVATQYDPNMANHHYGNDGRVLAFKLGGAPETPMPPLQRAPIPEPPVSTAEIMEIGTDRLAAGKKAFHQYCGVCHGLLVVGPYTAGIPDLRYSDENIYNLYHDIVLDGALAGNGMASFADVLDNDDVENIRAYVLSEAWVGFNKQKQSADKGD